MNLSSEISSELGIYLENSALRNSCRHLAHALAGRLGSGLGWTTLEEIVIYNFQDTHIIAVFVLCACFSTNIDVV